MSHPVWQNHGVYGMVGDGFGVIGEGSWFRRVLNASVRRQSFCEPEMAHGVSTAVFEVMVGKRITR